MKLKHLLLSFILPFFFLNGTSQVKIGDNPTTIDSLSVLELESTGKAIYLPRLTSVQRDAKTGWKAGMFIYNSTDSCVQAYNGIAWNCLVETNSIKPEPWFGADDKKRATSNTENIFHMGKVGIGTKNPQARFQVETETEDIAFLRYHTTANNDLDLDFIRFMGTKALPRPVVANGVLSGGIRFRVFSNPFGVGNLNVLTPIAEIQAATSDSVDGVFGGKGSPGKLVFRTTPIGEIGTKIQMTLNQNGDLKLENYGSSRDDSTVSISSLLFTDNNGNVLSTSVNRLNKLQNYWSLIPSDKLIKLNRLSNGTSRPSGTENFFFIRDNGQVVIGDSTFTSPDFTSAKLSIRTLDGTNNLKMGSAVGSSVIFMEGYKSNADGSIIRLTSGRGTEFIPAVVEENDRIGQFQFYGWTDRPGSNEGMTFGAAIRAEVDSTPLLGANRLATRFVFAVSDGITAPKEKMRITSKGLVGIGVNNPKTTLHIGGSDAIIVSKGTTAQRPATPEFGMVRYNSTIGRGEMYVNDQNGDGTLGDAGWRPM